MDKYEKSALGIIAVVSLVSVVYAIMIISGIFSFNTAFLIIWCTVIVPAMVRKQRLEKERGELNRA